MNRVWLIERRKSKGLTQKSIAHRLNISQQAYALYEKGKRNPPVASAKKIASILDFDWRLFFEEESTENVS